MPLLSTTIRVISAYDPGWSITTYIPYQKHSIHDQSFHVPEAYDAAFRSMEHTSATHFLCLVRYCLELLSSATDT